MEPKSGPFGRGRRRHTRYAVDGIFGSLLPSTPVTLVNLSRTGLAIEIPERLEVGETYLFRFQYRGQTATLEVKISWCRRRWGLRRWLRGEGISYVAGGNIVDLYRDHSEGFWNALKPEPGAARR